MTNRIVLLDAGHGGRDPGAIGNGFQEKDIVLDIVLRTGAYLNANFSNVNVRYTRTTDVFVTLDDRVRMINQIRPALFVSEHLNGFGTAQANGFETYSFNGTRPNNTANFQNILHNRAWEFLRANGIRSNRGQKRDNFQVLRQSNPPQVPAVLMENLFVTNPEDARNLSSTAFIQGIAVSRAEGIAQCLNLTRRAVVQPTQPVTPNNVERFRVVRDIGGFINAADAQNNRNQRTTVRTGEYYVFNRSNGMINVSTSRTQPGSWINPAHNAATQFFPSPANRNLGFADSLRSINVDNSFANRQVIARVNGMTGNTYTGSAAQNTQLLNLLRNGRLVRP